MEPKYTIININGNVVHEREAQEPLTLGQLHVYFVHEFTEKLSKLLWKDTDGEVYVSEFYKDGMPRPSGTPEVPLGSTLQAIFMERPSNAQEEET